MNFDSEASPSVVEADVAKVRPTASGWRFATASLKYLLLIVAVGSPYASAFLAYPLPSVSDSLYDLSWICWFPVFFVSLGVLHCDGDGIAVSDFAAAWIWLFFGPSHGPGESFRSWLVQQGFRFHASPVKDYLSKCKLIDFT